MAAVLVVYLAVNGVYGWLQASARSNATYHRIVFADRELQHPVSVPSPTDQARFDLVDPQWRGFRAYAAGYIPIVRWARVFQIKVAGQSGRLFFAPTVWYEADRLGARPDEPLLRAGSFCLSLTTLALAVALLSRRVTTLWRPLVGVLLLRVTSLLWTYWIFGFFTVHAGDEGSYLDTARKLLDWSRTLADTRYTIGNPILYLPLLLVRAAAWTEFGFVGVTSVLAFLTYGLGVVACWMWLVARVTKSLGGATWAGLALVLYPWLMRVFHVPGLEGGLFSYLGLRLGKPVEETFIDFFYFTDMVGYNALSDTPALLFALLAMILAQRAAGGSNGGIWAGLVFGFSLLIRISNIFLIVPVLLLLGSGPLRQLPKLATGFALGCGLGFLPQLVWNWAVLGNPVLFGYMLRPEDARGFELARLGHGVHVLGSTFQQLMIFSTLALLVLRRRIPLLAGVLATTIMPLLVFYAGYHAVHFCPVRFVLAPLTAMTVASALLLMVDHDERRAALVCLVVLLLLVPGTPHAAYLLPVGRWAAPLAAAVLAPLLFWWRKRWEYPLLCVLVGVGSPTLSFAAIVVACAFVVGFAARDAFSARPQATAAAAA